MRALDLTMAHLSTSSGLEVGAAPSGAAVVVKMTAIAVRPDMMSVSVHDRPASCDAIRG